MEITIRTGATEYRITCNHAASSYGIPVLVDADGRPYGPADVLPGGEMAASITRAARDFIERFCAMAPE